MPPKKNNKKKAADKKKDDLDGMPMSPGDTIKYLESQKQALEVQLTDKSETTADAIAACESMKEELATTTQKYQDEKQLTMDVTKTMTRQYKGMQEELLNKINERERIIQSLKDELETQKVFHSEEIASKNRVIEQKDADAAERREETDCMFKHFANLLVDARLQICKHTKDGGD